MEKKSFVTFVMGVVGGLLFSLGMCMALLPEWNMFNVGVGFGAVGAVAEGFKEAGKVVKKSLENAEKEKITEDTTAEEMNEETIEVPMTQEVVKTQTVQAEGETVIESV